MTMSRSVLLAVVAGAIVLATTACAADGNAPGLPSSTPISAGDLDAGTLAYLDANAKSFADQLGIADPPDIQPIRLITLNEWASTQIACLNEAGFDATETPDGQGVSYPQLTDSTLKESLNLAIYTCEVQYPAQQKYMTPLSDKGLEDLYEYRTGELLSCLEKEGYSVEAAPPSQTVFVQSGGAWSPFSEISFAEEDLKRVYTACPQTPDSVYDDSN